MHSAPGKVKPTHQQQSQAALKELSKEPQTRSSRQGETGSRLELVARWQSTSTHRQGKGPVRDHSPPVCGGQAVVLQEARGVHRRGGVRRVDDKHGHHALGTSEGPVGCTHTMQGLPSKGGSGLTHAQGGEKQKETGEGE